MCLDVEVSAKEGTNLEKLLEVILLQSEVLELKANPERNAEGVVIEAQLERGRGAVGTVLGATRYIAGWQYCRRGYGMG